MVLRLGLSFIIPLLYNTIGFDLIFPVFMLLYYIFFRIKRKVNYFVFWINIFIYILCSILLTIFPMTVLCGNINWRPNRLFNIYNEYYYTIFLIQCVWFFVWNTGCTIIKLPSHFLNVGRFSWFFFRKVVNRQFL